MPVENETLRLYAHGQTDIGRRRNLLEDAFYICDTRKLFIVSDGIGGLGAGELAAAVTVRTLPLELDEVCHDLRYTEDTECSVKADALVEVIDIVRNLLIEKTCDKPAAKGLGATVVTGFYVGHNTLAIAHLGDSRAYLLRETALERLTDDHTLANLLYQSGRIRREQVRRHPGNHILTRHIGMANCPSADVALLPLHAGDRLLFCTDGLTGMLSETQVGQLLHEAHTAEAACVSLIDAANIAGGHDNITTVVVDVLPRLASHLPTDKVSVHDAVGASLLPMGSGIGAGKEADESV